MAIGIGIIGMSSIAKSHLSGYLALGDRAKVLAVADIDTDSAGTNVSDCKAEVEVHADYRKVLDRPDVDLVSICLPNHLHVDVTIEALRAGKTVLCEKPLACSLRGIDAIVQAVAETGKQAFSVFQCRYGTSYRILRRLIADGRTGELYSGSAETNWKRYPAYYSGWHGTWEGEMGGCVLTCAIHALDVFLSIMGPPRTLFAQVDHKGHDIETEDVAVVAGRFGERNAPGCFQATTNDTEESTHVRFVFENLTAVSDASAYHWANGPWRFIHECKDKQPDLDAFVADLWEQGHTEGELHHRQVADIVRYAAEGGPPAQVVAKDARETIGFITRMYRSAFSGRPDVEEVGRDSPYYTQLHAGHEIRST